MKQEQAVVLRLVPALGRRSDDHRLVLQRGPDAPDLHAGLQSRPTVDDNVIKSGAVRLTYPGVAPGTSSRRYLDRHRQVPRPRVPGHRSRRGGLRHPQPQAVLHGAGRSTRRRSASSCWSKRGWSENDETYSTNEDQPRRRADRRRPDGSDDDRALELGDRPVLFPRAGPPHLYRRAVLRHGAHALKGGMQLGQGRQPASARDQRRHRPLPGIPDVNRVRRPCRWWSTTRRNGRQRASSTTSGIYMQDSLRPTSG